MAKCSKCGKCCESFLLRFSRLSIKQITNAFFYEALVFCSAADKINSGCSVDYVKKFIRTKRHEFYENHYVYPHEDLTVYRYMLKPLAYNKKNKTFVYTCNFLVNHQCTIYRDRPEMCRGYGIKYPSLDPRCSLYDPQKIE